MACLSRRFQSLRSIARCNIDGCIRKRKIKARDLSFQILAEIQFESGYP